MTDFRNLEIQIWFQEAETSLWELPRLISVFLVLVAAR